MLNVKQNLKNIRLKILIIKSNPFMVKENNPNAFNVKGNILINNNFCLPGSFNV